MDKEKTLQINGMEPSRCSGNEKRPMIKSLRV